MIQSKVRSIAIAAVAGAGLLFASGAKAELNTIELKVILGNHTDPWTTQIFSPFFSKTLKEASGGKITAKVASYTELGLGGYELMNLLKLGTNDIVWGVPGYLAGDAPIVEGLELPGTTGDYKIMFKVQDSYEKILDRELGKKFNSRVVMWQQQPALQAYCKLSSAEVANFSLGTLKGKKARVHSTSFADFAESLGMVPVTMPFTDVIPALERGVIDCALTSPTAAYGYKIGQVANTVVEILSGYSSQFFAMNLDTWNGLNDETKKFLTEQFAKVNTAARDFTPKIQEDAAKCLANGPCTLGEPARMAYVKLSDADVVELKKRVEQVVLPRWAKRCGAGCAKEWNDAAGHLFGMSINP